MRTPLPEPYASVELLPFNPQGWYLNQEPIEALFKRHTICTVVEVGSWLGLSTRHLASLLPKEGKVYAVDHWKGSQEHQHSPLLPHVYEQFLSNIVHARLTDRVIPVRMESLQAAENLTCKPDLIYIDASHEYGDVYADLCAWTPKGGIICGDDWLWIPVRMAVRDFAHEKGLHIHAEGNFWRLSSE